MSQNREIICVSNVHFAYESEVVLKDISFCIQEGDFLGLVGPNGGGKTTLIKILLGLLKPNSGTVRMFGNEPQEVSNLIGYVPQQTNLDKEFPITVEHVVLLGRLGSTSGFGPYRKRDRELAHEALRKINMLDNRNQMFGNLSGGQRQRVLIARALVGSPRLLIMDEPTANVDIFSQKQIYDLLDEINQTCTIILVSHDLSVVSAHVKSVACLNRKLVLHPTNEISSEMIEQMYHTPVKLVDHGKVL